MWRTYSSNGEKIMVELKFVNSQPRKEFRGECRTYVRGGVAMSGPSSRQVEAMVSAYQQGESLTDLGRRHDLDPTQVRRILLGKGVTMRPRGRRVCPVMDSAAQDFLRKAWLAGHSAEHIAVTLDCSPTTVRRRLRELGLADAYKGRRVNGVSRIMDARG